jgi:hypothetical protein
MLLLQLQERQFNEAVKKNRAASLQVGRRWGCVGGGERERERERDWEGGTKTKRGRGNP